MKKICKSLGLFFLCLTLLGVLMNLKSKDKEEPNNFEIYTITYKGVSNGKVIDIPYGMYSNDNISLKATTLPISYISGSIVFVGSLNNIADYTFNGWYLDEDLMIPFDGFVGDNESGNIVLYADIEKEIWSGNYT